MFDLTEVSKYCQSKAETNNFSSSVEVLQVLENKISIKVYFCGLGQYTEGWLLYNREFWAENKHYKNFKQKYIYCLKESLQELCSTFLEITLSSK